MGESSANECRGFMQNSKADASGSQAVFASAAASPWPMLLLVCAMSVLSGCANPPAPSPTPNPHPTRYQKLKISAEKESGVNRVEVESNWVVGDLSCAPVVWPSGSTKIKQVDVPEKVEKVGDDYIATLVMDRFLPDQCHWVGGGYGIKFYHDKSLLAATGGSIGSLHESGGVFEGVCVPPPDDPPPCFSRDKKHDLFLRSHFKGVFKETEELMPSLQFPAVSGEGH